MARSVFRNFFLFFDTETTDIPFTSDIIEIAFVLTEYKEHQFKLIASLNSYVHSNKRMNERAMAVHKIGYEVVKSARPFADVMQDLTSKLKEHICNPSDRCVLMAHNGMRFDFSMMFSNFVSNGMNFDDWLRDIRCTHFLDTLDLLKVMFDKGSEELKPKGVNNNVSYALGNCHQSFCGRALENAHGAKYDTEGLVDVMNSDPVRTKLSLDLLFKQAKQRDKCLKVVKGKAGVVFQQMEVRNTLPPSQKQESTSQILQQDPIFQSLPDDAPQVAYDACLACIAFVKREEKLTHQCVY